MDTELNLLFNKLILTVAETSYAFGSMILALFTVALMGIVIFYAMNGIFALGIVIIEIIDRSPITFNNNQSYTYYKLKQRNSQSNEYLSKNM